MPGTGGALAWANVGVSGQGNNDDTRGFDTLWGDGSGGAGSDLAVWPAADYTPANRSHFDSRDYWFAGALQKMATGWLGRWLDPYGSADNPLQAVCIDSSISKQIRTSKAPVSAIRSLNGVEFRVDNVATNLVNTTEQMAPRGGRAGGQRQRRPRPLARHLRPDRAGLALAAHPGRRAGERRLPAVGPLDPPAAGGDAAGGEPRREGRDDRLGLVRHPRQPARQPGPSAHDAVAGAGRLQGRPHRARHRGPRDDGRVLGVRAPGGLEQHRHRPRRRRPDDGHGLVGARRPARRPPRAERRSTRATWR